GRPRYTATPTGRPGRGGWLPGRGLDGRARAAAGRTGGATGVAPPTGPTRRWRTSSRPDSGPGAPAPAGPPRQGQTVILPTRHDVQVQVPDGLCGLPARRGDDVERRFGDLGRAGHRQPGDVWRLARVPDVWPGDDEQVPVGDRVQRHDRNRVGPPAHERGGLPLGDDLAEHARVSHGCLPRWWGWGWCV